MIAYRMDNKMCIFISFFFFTQGSWLFASVLNASIILPPKQDCCLKQYEEHTEKVSFYFDCNRYTLEYVENSSNKGYAQDARAKYNTKSMKIIYVSPKDTA